MYTTIFLLISLLLLPLLNAVDIKKAKVGEVELAYYTRGSGDPLVMIMGLKGTMAGWDPALLEELEKKFTLILFDNRGIGFSPPTSIPLTIPEMAKDTAGLIRSLGYKKAHVLGWSMGSRIALELTIKYPEVVDLLILCAPNPGGTHQVKPHKDEDYDKLTGRKVTQAEGLKLLFPETEEGKSAAIGLLTRLVEGALAGNVPADIEVSDQISTKQINALKLWDKEDQTYERLKGIKTPTLVTGGLIDVIEAPENVQVVACQIPFAWSAFFPGAGHYFLSQSYKNFSELVILFIESHRTK